MKIIYSPNNPAFGPWNSILGEGANSGTDCLAIHNPSGGLPQYGAGSNNGTGGKGVPTPAATGSGSSGMNVSSAVSELVNHAHPLNDYTGYCGVYVREAIAAGGLNQFNSGQGNAYQMGSVLTNAGFTTLYSGTYSNATANAEAWQAGDVAVFQPVPGHPNGHIAMYTGSEWVSDAVQNQMASNNAAYQGGSFTVYGP